MALNLDELFRATARRQPDHAAVTGPGDEKPWSYCRLDEAVDGAARRLERSGVGRGACVGLHVRSGAEYIVLTYALWRCGSCVVPVPAELAPAEKQELCRRIALDFVVTEQPGSEFLTLLPKGEARRLNERFSLVPLQPTREHPAGFERVNAAFIRFTSGTTAGSKGVVLSHETIRERIDAANEVLAIGPDDRVVWMLSMAYHFAVSIVGYLTFGAGIVLPRNHFAAEVLAACSRHRGTVIYASPTHYAWLSEYPQPLPLPDLRLAISTTAAIDRRAAEGFLARYGVPVSQALGIIEVGLPCINVPSARGGRPRCGPPREDASGGRAAGAPCHRRWRLPGRLVEDEPDCELPVDCESVGRVLPAYRLRMIDTGLGPRMKEIALAGPGFLDAYYDPWRTREQIMPDGWFRTGDVGELDDDGFLYIRGRSKDVINVLGMKFFPQEVEAVLLEHPAVQEACVFASPDDRFGEVPVARVVPSASTDETDRIAAELQALCRQRLADYKVPQRIAFARSLDRTASGKLLRREPAEKGSGPISRLSGRR